MASSFASSSRSQGLDAESREMVVEIIRRLKKKLLTKEKILEFDKNEIFPEEIIRQMMGPEIGLHLLFIPEEFGGMGGGARDCCAVIQEMCKICIGVGTAFFAIQLGSDPIIVGATKKQKEKWLSIIAEGNSLVAYAVTEAEAGSNLASLKTRAEPIFGDNENIISYKINGTKQFISTGGYADFVTVLATTPKGPAFFIVEKGIKGFEQGKSEEKHGIRASNTSPLSFSDVIIPADHLIGEVPGLGLKQANKVFGYTRLMVASMALGGAQAALEIAISYAKERIQFGTPLSSKQGYTHKLIIPHIVKIAAAEAYIDKIGLKLDETGEDFQVEGSIAKLFATEAANLAADAAIQALGGYGYIHEYQVEKIKRDVRITSIYEGTSEIQQNIISTFRWKKTRKTKGGFYEDLAVQMENLAEANFEIGAKYLALAARALNRTITLAHDNRLTRKQYVMFLLADIITFLEVGAGLAEKAQTLTKAGNPEAEKFCAMSRIFSNDVAQIVCQNITKIIFGSAIFKTRDAMKFLETISYSEMIQSCQNLIKDMDLVSKFIFED